MSRYTMLVALWRMANHYNPFGLEGVSDVSRSVPIMKIAVCDMYRASIRATGLAFTLAQQIRWAYSTADTNMYVRVFCVQYCRLGTLVALRRMPHHKGLTNTECLVMSRDQKSRNISNVKSLSHDEGS